MKNYKILILLLFHLFLLQYINAQCNAILGTGHPDANKGTGLPDGIPVKITSTNTNVTLDIGGLVNSGTNVVLRMARPIANTTQTKVNVSDSPDGVTFSAITAFTIPTGTTNYSDYNYTLTQNSRYIKFEYVSGPFSSSAPANIDAITSATCPVVDCNNLVNIVNSYAKVTSISGNVVTIGAISGANEPFNIDDKVVLIQMTGIPPVHSTSKMGNYELLTVSSVSGSNITLNAITKSYSFSTEKVQLVRVPTCISGTVTNKVIAKKWDGTTGGVLALNGNTITLNANIDATAAGFDSQNTPTKTYTASQAPALSQGTTDGRGKLGGNAEGGGGLTGGGGKGGYPINNYAHDSGYNGGGVGGSGLGLLPTYGVDGGVGGRPNETLIGAGYGSGGGGGIIGGGGGGGGGGGTQFDPFTYYPNPAGGGGVTGGGGGGSVGGPDSYIASLGGAGGGGVGGVGNGGSYTALDSEGGAGGGSYGGGGGGASAWSGGDDSYGGGGGGSWTGGGIAGSNGQFHNTSSGNGNDPVSIVIPDSKHYLNNTNSRIMMGGAGGSSPCQDGGIGGGIVILDIDKIIGNSNQILSNGESLPLAIACSLLQQTNPDIGVTGAGTGAAGGGGGGQMILDIKEFSSNTTIEAKGGKGGDGNNTGTGAGYHGGVGGGGGGGGGIWIYGLSKSTNTGGETISVANTNIISASNNAGAVLGGLNGDNILNPKNGDYTGTGGAGGNGLIIQSPDVPSWQVTCSISLTATPGSCNTTNNQYSVTGTLTFANAPTTGTLTVSVGSVNQVINPPFVSPQSYTLNGLISDGVSHTVTAVFSADATCTNTATYTAPVACKICPNPNCMTLKSKTKL